MAMDVTKRTLRTMPKDELVVLLGEVRFLTAMPRDLTLDDLTAQLALYARKLQHYPADVVRHTLRTWPDGNKFWPTWAELKPDLDLFTKPRAENLHLLTNPPTPMPEPRRRPADPATVKAILDKAYPHRRAAPGDDTLPDQTETGVSDGG